MKQYALVTGASMGIGRELALQFAADGFDLVLAARTESKLESLAAEAARLYGTRSLVAATDLTVAGAADDLADRCAEEGIEPEVVVNNAGVGHFGPFVEISAEDHLSVLALNVVALTTLTRRLLPGMVRRGSGRILNVASVAAFHPTPMLGLYGATKAFVLSLSESLAVELEGTGVTVTALCPGFTDTELVHNIAEEAGDPHMVPDLFMLDATQVAREGFEACMAGRTVEVNGLSYKLALQWEQLQPRWLVRTVNGWLGNWLAGR